jgi:methylmalonyl-CoA/ethylmalonyl-CoA epimerase
MLSPSTLPTVGTSAVPGYARVDHIGIAVADLPSASAFYQAMLGVEAQTCVLPDQGISVAMFTLPSMRIELLAALGSESPIAHVLEDYTVQAFLARQPLGGLHHVCYLVADLDAAQPAGTRRLGSGIPIIGAHGQPVVFLDPKTTGGTLIELKQSA